MRTSAITRDIIVGVLIGALLATIALLLGTALWAALTLGVGFAAVWSVARALRRRRPRSDAN